MILCLTRAWSSPGQWARSTKPLQSIDIDPPRGEVRPCHLPSRHHLVSLDLWCIAAILACLAGLPWHHGTWWLWYAKVSGGIRTWIVVDAIILHFPERARGLDEQSVLDVPPRDELLFPFRVQGHAAIDALFVFERGLPK
jgi:hypothetical protein